MAGTELSSAFGRIDLDVSSLRAAADTARTTAAAINESMGGSGQIVGQAAEQIAQSMARVAGSIQLQERQYAVLRQELAQTAERYGETSIQAEKKRIALDRLDQSIQANKARLADLNNQLGETKQGFLDFGGIVTGIAQGAGQMLAQGIAGIGQSIAGLAGEMISGNTAFEQYRVQFGVLLGSADAAQQRIEELAQFGASTPFDLPGVVEADKVLQGFGLHSAEAAQRFGYSGTQIRTIAGDVAAGTGAAFTDIANVIGKFSSGATGEAISRLQELGVVTRDQLRQMGVEFSKSGELTSPLSEAMNATLTLMQDKYGGMMDAQSKTFGGMLSNLSDWKDQALRTLGEPTFKVLEDQLASLLVALNQPGFKAAIAAIGDALGAMAGKAAEILGKVVDGIALIGNGFDYAKTAGDKWLAGSESYQNAAKALDTVRGASEDVQRAIQGQSLALEKLRADQELDVAAASRMAMAGEANSQQFADLQARIQQRSQALADGAAVVQQAVSREQEHAAALAATGETASLTGEQIQQYTTAAKTAAADGQKAYTDLMKSDDDFREKSAAAQIDHLQKRIDMERDYMTERADTAADGEAKLAEVEAKGREKVVSMIGDYQGKIAQIDADLGEKRQAQAEKNADAMAAIEERLTEARADAARGLSDAIAQADADLASSRAEAAQDMADTQRRIAEDAAAKRLGIERDLQQKITDLRLDANRSLSDLGRDTAIRDGDAQEGARRKAEDAERDHQRKLADLQASLAGAGTDKETAAVQKRIDAENLAYQRKQEDQRTALDRELADIQEAADRKREAINRKLQEEIQDQQTAAARKREANRADEAQAQADLVTANAKKLSEVDARHAAELAKAQQANARALVDAQTHAQQAQAQQAQTNARALAELDQHHAQTRAKEQARFIEAIREQVTNDVAARITQQQANAAKLADLAAQHGREVASADAAYAQKTAKVAAEHARDRAELLSHLGQTLVDYTTAQGRLNGVADQQLGQMTDSLRRQYGVQQDITRIAFGSMTGDIDRWASSATASIARVAQAQAGASAGHIPGRASGGVVSGGGLYEVNEGGAPELLNVGGRTFLMMGAESGAVQPAVDYAAAARGLASAGGAGPSLGGGSVTNNTNSRGGDIIINAPITTTASAQESVREINMYRAIYAGGLT